MRLLSDDFVQSDRQCMRSITLALGSEPLPTQIPADEGNKEIDREHTLEAKQNCAEFKPKTGGRTSGVHSTGECMQGRWSAHVPCNHGRQHFTGCMGFVSDCPIYGWKGKCMTASNSSNRRKAESMKQRECNTIRLGTHMIRICSTNP